MMASIKITGNNLRKPLFFASASILLQQQGMHVYAYLPYYIKNDSVYVKEIQRDILLHTKQVFVVNVCARSYTVGTSVCPHP